MIKKIAIQFIGNSDIINRLNMVNKKAFENGTYQFKSIKMAYPVIDRLLKRENKIILNTVMEIFKGLQKFHLINGVSKAPSIEWHKSNRHLWSTTKNETKHKNWGLPMGKINNIILVDLDNYKWTDDHPFYKLCNNDPSQFKTYIKNLNTVTIKTGHNGIHLFFKYTNKLKTKDDKLSLIDIKSNGSYAVGVGSKIIKEEGKCPKNQVGKLGYYKIASESSCILQEIPNDLLEWLLKYQQPNQKPVNKISKIKKGGEKANEREIARLNKNLQLQENCKYNYDISDELLKTIIIKIPINIWGNFDDWFKLTTAFKGLNKKEEWKKYSKLYGGKSYNKLQNEKIWDNITMHNRLDMITWLLNLTNTKLLKNDIQYKPISCSNLIKYGINNNIPYIEIHRRKLGKLRDTSINALPNDTNYINLNNYNDVIIKSDTATGKTSLVIDYIKKHPQPIISFVSRICLADSHFEAFQNAGINIYNYRMDRIDDFITGQSVVCTLESIKKISNIDISEYVIFLDEYDSLIKHLISSNKTLKGQKAKIWILFRKILKGCKKIIIADADIHINRLKFVADMDRKFQLIHNSFKHNKGIEMSELFNFNQFMENISKVDDKIICCDSKKDADIIFKKLIKKNEAIPFINDKLNNNLKINHYIYIDNNKKTYALITSDTSDYIKLDDYDIIVFSPKIIHGLDSIRKRPVFAHYKEHTINPRAMLQQIARCRNITYLKYIFYKKKFQFENYPNRNTVKYEFSRFKDLLYDFEDMVCEREFKLYEEMMIDLEYEEDCYNTNKSVHFRIGAIQKGFIGENIQQKTCNDALAIITKEHNNEQRLLFNPLDERWQKINKYLCFPTHIIDKERDLFLKQSNLDFYFNKQKFFYKSKNDNIVSLKKDDNFIIDKLKSNTNKIIFVGKVLSTFGIHDKTNIICNKKINKVVANKLQNEYKLLFRDRGAFVDLTCNYNQLKFVIKIYKKMFGNVFTTKRITKKEKHKKKRDSKNNYTFNIDDLEYHLELCRYADRDLIKYEPNFVIGEESIFQEKKWKKYHKYDMENTLDYIKRPCEFSINIIPFKNGGSRRDIQTKCLLDSV
mgnify:CR=1 FL=1|tara:strand:- start:11616 stop:14855 length:3240 start_codon:yes stop_codon:yes gene_type:complete